MEICSSITNHQGNMNQNNNEIAPHTVRMAVIKKMKITNACENVEKGNTKIIGWNVNCWGRYGEE